MEPTNKQARKYQDGLGWHITRPGNQVFIAGIVAILSAILCGWVTHIFPTLPFWGSWEQIPSPAAKVTELITADEYGDLFVRTVDGGLFACGNRRGQCTGVRTEEINYSHDLCDLARHYNLSDPPGTVVESIELNLCGVDTALQANYALLSDGTIWEQIHFFGPEDMWLVSMVTPIVCVIVFVAGLVNMSVWRRREAKRHSEAEASHL